MIPMVILTIPRNAAANEIRRFELKLVKRSEADPNIKEANALPFGFFSRSIVFFLKPNIKKEKRIIIPTIFPT